MNRFRLCVLTLFVPGFLCAESVFLKDGKIHSAKELRKEGNFLFFKSQGQDGTFSDTVTPLNQIDRVEFGDLPALAEARQMARQGDAVGVLEKTAAPAAFFRSYSDVPGNQWSEVMRLRLPALAVAGTETTLAELQSLWINTGDPELDTAYRLLLAAKNDPAGAHTAWKALSQPGASSLAAGISWLELGKEALLAKQWNTAIRAFLSVEVFVPGQRLLQPKALLGAAEAFVRKGEKAKAAALAEDIKTEYPTFTADASALLK
jgi:hypothetical protein